jgi:hypothetical protein
MLSVKTGKPHFEADHPSTGLFRGVLHLSPAMDYDMVSSPHAGNYHEDSSTGHDSSCGGQPDLRMQNSRQPLAEIHGFSKFVHSILLRVVVG